MKHICEVCSQPGHDHTEQCARDHACLHWPPLCCPGCPCRSFEDAHAYLVATSMCGHTIEEGCTGHGDF